MAQATGLNRSTLGRRFVVVTGILVFRFFCMAIRAPFKIVEAAETAVVSAALTGFKTIVTVAFTAGVTGCDTGCTVRRIAGGAAALALTTNGLLTTTAGIGFVVVNYVATIETARALPEGQFDERTLGVVRSQDRSHEHKKIE